MIFGGNILSRKETLLKIQEIGLLNSHESADNILIKQNQKNESPWFIRVFIGISAWLSTGLSLIFLFSVKAISGNGSLLLGILFLVFSILLTVYNKKNDFLEQLSLVFNFCGQIFIAIGLHSFHFKYLDTLSTFVFLEIVLFILLQDEFQKILSASSVPILLAIIFIELHLEILVHVLILFQASCIVFLFEKEEYILSKKYWLLFEKSLRYSMILSFLSLMGLIFIIRDRGLSISHWYISGVGITICVLYLGWSLIHPDKKIFPINTKSSIGIFFVIVLGFVSAFAPGIPASILILIIALSKKNLSLFGVGVLFLVAFLFGYYYNLNLTLLMKSVALMISGIFLLLFRFLFLKIYSEEMIL